MGKILGKIILFIGPMLLEKLGPILLEIIVKRAPKEYAKKIKEVYQRWIHR